MTVLLPTISQLQAFQAAATYLSFTEAAQRLAITQAALSLRVQALEERLGLKLFKRGKHLSLTPDGLEYLAVANDVLRRLEEGSSRFSKNNKKSLKILVTQSVSSLWLIPRLSAFSQRNQQMKVAIVNTIGGSTAIRLSDLAAHDADLAILNARRDSHWPNLHSEIVVGDYSVPVCAPSALARQQMTVEDLAEHDLINTERWPHAWQQWLAWAGSPNLAPKANVWFHHTGLSVQAAVNSLGFAIAHGPLIADDILSGRLKAPFSTFMPNDLAYFLVTPTHRAESAEIQSFKAWFHAEITHGLEQLRKRGFQIAL